MIPQTLFNTNMFIGGQSLQGDVPSLSLPKVTVKTEEYRGGGMDASVTMDMGLEKLEAGFATNGVRREVLKYFRQSPLPRICQSLCRVTCVIRMSSCASCSR